MCIRDRGRGTEMQFQIFGHPNLPKSKFNFTPKSNFGAKYPKLDNKICYGVDLRKYNMTNKIELKWIIYSYSNFPEPKSFFQEGFYRIAGTKKLKTQIEEGLSEEEINKMVKEAEANAEADRKKRESVDVKNQADKMIHSAEKNLKEFGDKVSEQEKNAIENDIKALKEAVASDDTDKIKSGLEALTQSSMKLGEAMYKAQQQDAPNPNEPSDNTSGGSDQNNEKVVDAEFEEVKEDNKQS